MFAKCVTLGIESSLMRLLARRSDPRTSANARIGMFLVVGVLLCQVAGADWLITTDGQAIQTKGAWKVEGPLVLFTNAQGEPRSLHRGTLDLERSKRVTTLALNSRNRDSTGSPPSERPSKKTGLVVTDNDIRKAAKRAPTIVMYSTSWCGYCRKARKQLIELGADFVEKDIEKSSTAHREHAALANGRGVPLFDYGGYIIRGYSAAGVARLVEQQRQWTSP